MADVGEGGLDAIQHLDRFAVGLRGELLHHGQGVLHGVVGFDRFAAAALGLAVLPFGFLLLDVGGILQHDIAQVGGGVGGKDGAAETVFVQVRQPPGMVDVRVG